jgi:hypothetical protein
MSSEAQPEPATGGEIQFDRADFVQPSAGPICAQCGRSLAGHYFEVNGAMVCEGCRYAVETAFQQRGGLGGFVKAAFAGFGAAVAGSILYYAVREISGLEIGLISILVGWGVGKSVRWGSKAKGGWAYQSLAIFLTYMAIVSTYLPAIFHQLSERQGRAKAAATAPAPAGGAATVPAQPVNPAQPPPPPREHVSFGEAMLGLGAILLLAAVIPFLAGAKNLIGLLIIGFGLWEAWKLNRRAELAISGPFRVGAAAGDAPTGS